MILTHVHLNCCSFVMRYGTSSTETILSFFIFDHQNYIFFRMFSCSTALDMPLGTRWICWWELTKRSNYLIQWPSLMGCGSTYILYKETQQTPLWMELQSLIIQHIVTMSECVALGYSIDILRYTYSNFMRQRKMVFSIFLFPETISVNCALLLICWIVTD